MKFWNYLWKHECLGFLIFYTLCIFGLEVSFGMNFIGKIRGIFNSKRIAIKKRESLQLA